MICTNKCPRGIACEPISNIITEDNNDFVCIGYHNEKKEDHPQDRFRHCFKSNGGTDSMFDYDEYDIKSVISVMSEALLIDELTTSQSVGSYDRVKIEHSIEILCGKLEVCKWWQVSRKRKICKMADKLSDSYMICFNHPPKTRKE